MATLQEAIQELNEVVGVKPAIARVKKALIKKAQKKGLWENFGDKEIRKLKDKYGYDAYSRYSDPKAYDVYISIKEFEDWCMNADLSTIKRGW